MNRQMSKFLLAPLLYIFVISLSGCSKTSWDTEIPDVKPKAIHIPTPHYPEEVRKYGIEGSVVTRDIVDVDGTIAYAEIWISSGYEILDNAALQAARGALFEPGLFEGEPVRVWVMIPFQFRLTN